MHPFRPRGPSQTAGTLATLLLVAGCSTGTEPQPSTLPSAPVAYPSVDAAAAGRWVPEIVARLSHDAAAWTQGLVIADGVLYESTGLYDMSTIRELDRSTGEVQRVVSLDPELYGEGIAAVGDRLLQLTWREETLLVRDRETLTDVDRIGYTGEGWGLCLDGDRLVMSDGSSTLTFRDPASFEEIDSVTVSHHAAPLTGLNELECVAGLVFANVLPSSEIAVIEPDGGSVVATIDASALEAEVAGAPDRDALNGIAHDPATGTFLLTGKRWPTMFEVRFVPAP